MAWSAKNLSKRNMFKLRLLSAIILIPLVVLGLLYLPSAYIAVGSGIVFIGAAWEWLRMAMPQNPLRRAMLLTLLIVVASNLLYIGLNEEWIYWLALMCWLCGFIGICYYPRGTAIWQEVMLQPFVGLVMFVPGWVAFNQLHSYSAKGPIWVLLGCCLIWGADIGAYCTGKLWGKEKLIPEVSPGKTWAGFYGALAAGMLIMSVFYLWFKPSFPYVYALWLALIVVLFAVVGDLVESLLKRVYGFKDSGNIIPGHGGFYDRIDSMLAAFPIYVLGLHMIFNTDIMLSVR